VTMVDAVEAETRTKRVARVVKNCIVAFGGGEVVVVVVVKTQTGQVNLNKPQHGLYTLSPTWYSNSLWALCSSLFDLV